MTAEALPLNTPSIPSATTAASSRVPVTLFATATGIIITNLFAPQTLLSPIASTFHLSTSTSGLVATVSLLGYAAGLFFLVPLADLVENRRLVLQMLTAAVLAAGGIAFVSTVFPLFALLFILGAACSAIQVLIPAAAAMTAPEHRGRVIGDIMSGLMVGILLSRPAASFLAGAFGWRAFYLASAAAMTALAFTLALRLPPRYPERTAAYPSLLASLFHLFTTEPVLRHRSLSAAITMAAFNFFWTTVAFLLSASPFHLGQKSIALFALVGAGGAVVTPLVGRLSDRGLGRRVTQIAHLVLISGFLLAAFSATAHLPVPLLLIGLGLSAVLLDIGVLGDQTVGRYLINQLQPEARGRINGIFSGTFFIGGAAGSALSSLLFSAYGFPTLCAAGIALALLALLLLTLTWPKPHST